MSQCRVRLMYLLKDGKGLGLEVQRDARPLGREARPFHGLRRLVVGELSFQI